MKWIVAIALLDLVYLTTLGTVSWHDAVLGAFWAALLTAWGAVHVRRKEARPKPPSWAARAVWLIPLVAVVLANGLRNAIRTLRAVNGGRARPGVIEVPIGGRSRTGIAVTALCTTLSPGSIFLEADERRGVMLFHYVDAGDPEAVRRAQARFYERYQRRVCP